jgi:hypothetical protein
MDNHNSGTSIDLISGLPQEIIELIFHFCAEESSGIPDRTFVQFQFLPGKRSYFEYTGEMKRGMPNGYGTLYHGACHWDSVPASMPRRGDFRQSGWLLQPLLYVFPREAKIMITGSKAQPSL